MADNPPMASHSARTFQLQASDGSVHIWLDHNAVAKFKALRGTGESYSDAIIRVASVRAAVQRRRRRVDC
jgi:hypothetical protein